MGGLILISLCAPPPSLAAKMSYFMIRSFSSWNANVSVNTKLGAIVLRIQKHTQHARENPDFTVWLLAMRSSQALSEFQAYSNLCMATRR